MSNRSIPFAIFRPLLRTTVAIWLPCVVVAISPVLPRTALAEVDQEPSERMERFPALTRGDDDLLMEEFFFDSGASDSRPVVFLGGREMVIAAPGRTVRQKSDLIQDPFFDELLRQAVLVSARDELGYVTRDFWLGESVGEADATRLDLEWYDTRTGASGTRAMRFRFRRPDAAETEKQCDLLVGWAREPNDSERDGWYRSGPLICLEKASRQDFADLLAEVIGSNRRPNRWFPQGKVPNEIHQLLNDPTFTSQFAAVRQLHRLIREDGESLDRLAALVWGYIHLGYLTECYHHPMHEVFKARALIYAARIQSRSREFNQVSTLSHVAVPVALALTGFQTFLPKDFMELPSMDSADSTSPPWLLLGGPCARYDLDALERLAKRPTLENWAPLFYLSHLSYSGNEPETLKLQRAMLEQFPLCFRIWTTPAHYWGVVDPIPGRAEGPRTLGANLYHRLDVMRDMPQPLRPKLVEGSRFAGNSWTTAEFRTRAELMSALLERDGVGGASQDPNEMSWQVLGCLIKELTFTQAAFLEFYMKSAGVHLAFRDYQIAIQEPALKDHRMWDMVEAYHSGQQGIDASQRLVDKGPGVLYDEFYRTTPFETTLWQGLEHDLAVQIWMGVMRRLMRKFQIPHARNKFYQNVRDAVRHPLTDENNETGIVDRIEVPATNPWMVLYQINHEWSTLDSDKIQRLWDRYEEAPGVRRAIALQSAKSGEPDIALPMIADVLRATEAPDWELHRALANLLLNSGDLDGFASTCREFLQHPKLDDPGDIVAAAWLAGYTLLSRGRSDDAAYFLERGGQTPTDLGQRCLAFLGEAQGRTDESLKLFQGRAEGNLLGAIEWYWACIRTASGDVDAASDAVRRNSLMLQPLLETRRMRGRLWVAYNMWAIASGEEDLDELANRFGGDSSGPAFLALAILLEMQDARAKEKPLEALTIGRRYRDVHRLDDQSSPVTKMVTRLLDLPFGDSIDVTDLAGEEILRDSQLGDQVALLYLLGKYAQVTGDQQLAVDFWKRAVQIPLLANDFYNLAVCELRNVANHFGSWNRSPLGLPQRDLD